MSKHTHGPWKVGHAITSDQIAIAPGDTKDGDIATPICLISPINKYTVTDEANAKLIAAAPELLQALKNLVLWQYGTINHYQALEDAAETIKKATK